ncbi:unnamed protein product [Sphagnum troendelagicum]
MWARAECIGTISTNATEGVKPDHVTFVGILNACASVAALEEGAHAHQHIIQSGWESDVFVGSSFIDIYAKCGSMQDAWKVSTRCPFAMWSLGMQCLKDLPCMDMVRWRFHILNGCAKV